MTHLFRLDQGVPRQGQRSAPAHLFAVGHLHLDVRSFGLTPPASARAHLLRPGRFDIRSTILAAPIPPRRPPLILIRFVDLISPYHGAALRGGRDAKLMLVTLLAF